jgi:hypothetical protein
MTFLPAAEIDPNSVRPGWVALLIVLALGAATVLLWRNMGKQLKKIDFDGDNDSADGQAPSDGRPTADSSPAPAGDAAPTEPQKTTDAPKAAEAAKTADSSTESDAKAHF